MSDVYTRHELMGARPVFCVQFDFAGKTHRYSTEYITLTAEDGDVYEYLPTIRDFDYTESAPILSPDVEDNIVMMGLVLQDVNVLEQWARGITLEGTNAEFFYVLTKYEQVQQTYSQRVILYTGTIESPQIGDPDDLDQFVSFSIESPPYDASNLLLDSNRYIDDRFSTRSIDTADGKPYPIVLGSAGYNVLQTEGTQKNIYALPAYCTKEYDSHNARFMIAGHAVEAQNATIQDDNYETATKAVQVANDGRGNVYSYIEIVPSDNVAMPGYTGSGDSRQWWFYLDGGGLPNQFGDGDLSRGGDICRWALTKSGTRFDDAAWANLSVILNQYSFAGYITDPEITAFEWLQANIIPHLPISVHVGARGLRPILNQMWALTHVSAVTSISIGDDKECIQTSPITSLRDTTDLVNTVTLRYAKRGHDQSHTNLCRITDVPVESYDVPTNYAKKSVNLYGHKPATIEADYIYDRDTAVKIAMDMVRSNCLPVYSVQVDAPAEFGYLRVGDILDATIERYFVIDRRMIVSAKVWSGNRWTFTLLFE
jgi:hypothetical protein